MVSDNNGQLRKHDAHINSAARLANLRVRAPVAVLCGILLLVRRLALGKVAQRFRISSSELEVFFRNPIFRSLLLPVNAKDPPASSIVE